MTSTEQLWIQMVPGIRRMTTSAGEQLMQMKVLLDQGSKLPEHQHPHEQISFIMSGRLRLHVGGQAYELGPGDSLLIPGNVPHSAEVLEDTVAIDTFSPPRADLLAEDVDYRSRNA